MSFAEDLAQENFLITAELIPPRGTDFEYLLLQADELWPFVNAFNLPDNPGARLHAAPLGLAHRLQARGFECIYQVACRDRNRIALQADLLAAHILGIRNVLVVTGDHTILGDHPASKPVYDLDSVQLLALLNKLNRGFDANDRPLTDRTEFCYGAVVNPVLDGLDAQIWKLRRKVESGTSFVQTQAVFDPEAFRLLMESIKDIPVKVLAGILPLRSARMARWVNHNVPGISIPLTFINRLETAQDPVLEGWRITEEIVVAIKEICDGLHFMPLGDSHGLAQFLKFFT